MYNSVRACTHLKCSIYLGVLMAGLKFLCNAGVLTEENKLSPGAIAISLEIALKGFPRFGVE